jgi:hypothetical protein
MIIFLVWLMIVVNHFLVHFGYILVVSINFTLAIDMTTLRLLEKNMNCQSSHYSYLLYNSNNC